MQKDSYFSAPVFFRSRHIVFRRKVSTQLGTIPADLVQWYSSKNLPLSRLRFVAGHKIKSIYALPLEHPLSASTFSAP